MKRKLIVLALSLAVLAGVTLAILRSLEAEERRTFAIGVDKAITLKLPTCIPSPANCRWRLWRAQRQAVTADWISWDLYARFKGRLYHAHGYRTTSASGTHWVWIVDGHWTFYEALKWFAVNNPGQVAFGPTLLEKVRDTPTACNQIAPKAFLNITGDGGQLVQPAPTRTACAPPTDGGVPGDCTVTQQLWPDGGAVANCGGAYWLARCRFGGAAPSGQADVDAGFEGDAGAPAGAVLQEVQEGVPEEGWIAPDARVSHTCTLPIGQSCP